MKGSKLVVKKSIILGNFFEEGEREKACGRSKILTSEASSGVGDRRY
jgi:hypothetical protein